MNQRIPCAGCGTTAYNKADMVGDLCPACAAERDLAKEVDAVLVAAEQRQQQLKDQREERQKRVDDEAKAKAEADKSTSRKPSPAPDADLPEPQAGPHGEVPPRKPAVAAK
jgi:hypothetical protein